MNVINSPDCNGNPFLRDGLPSKRDCSGKREIASNFYYRY